MSDTTVFTPDYYRVFECREGKWFIKVGKLFYSKLPFAVDFNDFELLYGITKQQIIIELFRAGEGKSGYYLANLRGKQFYYCGIQPENVKFRLRKLGIGRDDPTE
ncbi:hypothetical protein [Anabaena catenula]|uniref:Uncharacterized protein n=1 Tax=Anabaena catenula FACHB-362 TaxID=2692877 RepID=A0ABR8J0P7_9NOST|nr:hypothetical protein [Anabaena catenula]MBD2690611.1 hypothetical protein [Anabaena catenula FACHB-362]